MIIVFGNGKCPLCGDFGKELDKKTFACAKCEIAFDEFIITNMKLDKEYEYKHWN